MTELTCLLIKPYPSTPEGRETQQSDIQDIIEAAISGAGLKMANAGKGITVEDDIPRELIRQLYDADVVVVDANRYEEDGVFKLSPFLYYLMGVHHALSNRTILVSTSRAHLPATLQMGHTLFYERTVPGARKFARRFQSLIRQIKADWDQGEPGNPVQSYRRHKEQLAREKELARERAEKKALEEDLAKKKEELEKARQQGKRPSTVPQRIEFRPVGKKE